MPEPETEAPIKALSPEPIEGDAATTEQSSSPRSEAKPLNLWEKIFGRKSEEPTSETEQPADEAEPPAETEEPKESTRPVVPATSPRITLTEEELNRRVQAETDRREAKRKADQEAEAKRKLRDENPYEYVEQEKKTEELQTQQEQLMQFVHGLEREYDKHTLDVLLGKLPEEQQQALLKIEGAGAGLTGRTLLVEKAAESLEKHGYERGRAEGQRDTEKKLRADPVYRKQLFQEFRDQVDEPELLPATSGAAPTGDPFMDRIFRDYRLAKHGRE